MMPTTQKNSRIVPIIRPNISVSSEVSQTLSASRSSGSKRWRAGQHPAHVAFERPVDVGDAAGARVEHAFEPADDVRLRRDDDLRQRARRRVGPGKVAGHRRKRHEHLVVVGAAVVAVLLLLPDLADDGVGHAVDLHDLAEPLAGAEELRPGVGADDRDAAHLRPRRASRTTRPALDVDGADRLVLRLDAVHAEGRGVEAALHLQRRRG